MPPILEGRRVTLRPFVDADIAARLALGRDPEIHRLYGGSRKDLRPLTLEDAQGWVRSLRRQPYAWALDHHGLIGHVRLHGVNTLDRRASLAIGIESPASLGQGLGTEAIRLVIDHAFGEMGLHRLSLRVLALNERAIRAYQKCGFRVEGREREAALIDGVWHDDLIMGLLATDCPENA